MQEIELTEEEKRQQIMLLLETLSREDRVAVERMIFSLAQMAA